MKAAREGGGGKPETFHRPDYNFRLRDKAADGPAGSETVQISVRQRGAPLDCIVAEAMSLANSTWGGWLAECGVPGIYRSQAALAPGVKVRMGTSPAPPAGMGVAQYSWASSPLRRSVDLVTQWQIIACARHGRTAALAAASVTGSSGVGSASWSPSDAAVRLRSFRDRRSGMRERPLSPSPTFEAS